MPAPRKSKRKRQVRGQNVSQQRKKKKATLLLQRYLRGRQARQRARIQARLVFEKVYDDSTGTYFYYNKHTQESVWRKPKVLGNEQFDSLPSYIDLDTQADILTAMASVWEEQIGVDGSITYYNAGSGEMTSELPEILQKARDIAKQAQDELHEDYERVVDPSTGSSIYVNTITGEQVKKKPIRKIEEEKVEDADGQNEDDRAQDELLIDEESEESLNDEPVRVLHENLAKEVEDRLTEYLNESQQILDLSHLWMSSLPKSVLLGNSHVCHLSLRGNRLESLPIDIKVLNKLESLDVSGNRFLSAIPVQIWYFMKLRTLDLSDNCIEELPRETGNMTTLRDLNIWELAIDNMKSLVNLRLDFNRIKEIPVELGKLETLEILTIGHNCLTQLPDELNQLAKLRILNVQHNNLTALTENFEKLASIEELNVCGNKLEALPVLLGHLPGLKVLNATDNKLTKLPDSLTLQGTLEVLVLARNCLRAFPPEFGKKIQTTLRYLDVSHNSIDELRSSTLELSELEFLDMSHNKIVKIPETIQHARKKLETLNLSYNNIEKLPDAISRLAKCVVLHVQHNKLASLPEDMSEMVSLGDLDASFNQIKELPNTIKVCRSLTMINLEQNSIAKLCEGFNELIGVQQLNLRSNKLEVLPPEIGDLVRLRLLDLEHNKVSKLPQSFGNLKCLRTCKLSFNCLKEKPAVLSQLTDLLSVNMGFNDVPEGDVSLQRVAINLITAGDDNVKEEHFTKAYDQYSAAIEMLSDPSTFMKSPQKIDAKTEEARSQPGTDVNYEDETNPEGKSSMTSDEREEDENTSLKESFRVYRDETRLKRVMVLRRMHKPKMAMKDCNIVISNTDEQSAPAFYLRGCTNLEAQSSVNALHDFTKALSLLPGYILALKGRARAHYALGNYMECTEDTNVVLEEDLFDAEMHTLRGMALMKLGRIQLALDAFKDAIDYCDSEQKIYESYHYRGLILWELGSYKDAVREFELAKKCAVTDAAKKKLARLCLSSVLQRVGNPDRALREYEGEDDASEEEGKQLDEEIS